MELNQWIAELTDDTAQDIAKRAGLPKRTVQHQLNTGRMSLENIIKIAVAYSRHPLRTLIEWEVIDPAWASVPDIEAALRLASEDQLGDEVIRRMKLNPESVGNTTVDELAARRSSKTAPTVEPISEDELDEAVRDANARPRAAHPADGIEYTEPEAP